MTYDCPTGISALSLLHPGDAEARFAGEDEQLVRWLTGGPSTGEGVEGSGGEVRGPRPSAHPRAGHVVGR
ncbi:hypothetical protein [Streptomyces sp. NPDC002490]|uniref:hypothetical protein n=1 Tax=Streptomyces sp. NPDC002490 TaxID=3154416 RepID=UPI00332B8FF7